MNREILFRAKHIHSFAANEHLDGRWIEGYLSSEKYINSPELEGEFLIDESTICQYIGLTDKNGKKIFEGDIVKSDLGKVGKIAYNETHLAYLILENTEMKYYYIQECDSGHIEVIGNIFDNPDLIEK